MHTSTQQPALKRLEQTVGPRRRYTSEDRGSSIVRQVRLYLEREDATKIGQALYRYLTLKIPFIIAHYGLVAPDGSFRTYYQEPARLLADIFPHKQELEDRIERGDPDTVYSDGEDDLTVTRQVLALAESTWTGYSVRRSSAAGHGTLPMPSCSPPATDTCSRLRAIRVSPGRSHHDARATEDASRAARSFGGARRGDHRDPRAGRVRRRHPA